MGEQPVPVEVDGAQVKINVWGLGRVGTPLASVFKAAGFIVRGIDHSAVIQQRAGQKEFDEPNVDLTDVALCSIHEAPKADVHFVIVPTPSLDSGAFDPGSVTAVVSSICMLQPDALVAIVSTVSPGTCEMLSARCPTIRLVYNPTFIALGNVVKGLTNPDLLLIGEGRFFTTADLVDKIWSRVFKLSGADPYRHTSIFREIELLKLSVNCALGTKISLANSLGRLFAKHGVDPAAVAVLGKDPRLGLGYLTPGSLIAGPCLPRDNKALRHAAFKAGVSLPLSMATDQINDDTVVRMFNLIKATNKTLGGSVGIVGMSYKYGLNVVTDSMGTRVQAMLAEAGITTITYDRFVNGCSDDKDFEVLLQCPVILVTQQEYSLIVSTASSVIIPGYKSL